MAFPTLMNKKVKFIQEHVVSVDAPAKLNLYLHVTDQRPDKLHDIDSLVIFIPPYDKISVKRSNVFSLNIKGPFASNLLKDDGQNLVELAAFRLADLFGIKPFVEITLVKNLPISAGIGGGSSDAAATIKALIELWNVDLEPQRIQVLARSLGADVPMCLYGKACFVGGTGDKICPAPSLPSFGVLLVNPQVPLATIDVFKARKGPFSGSGRFQNDLVNATSLTEVLAMRTNDLEKIAIGKMPVIQNVLESLTNLSGCSLARMSGSGATCFGLFDSEYSAIRGAEVLGLQNKNWWIRPSKFNC